MLWRSRQMQGFMSASSSKKIMHRESIFCKCQPSGGEVTGLRQGWQIWSVLFR